MTIEKRTDRQSRADRFSRRSRQATLPAAPPIVCVPVALAKRLTLPMSETTTCWACSRRVWPRSRKASPWATMSSCGATPSFRIPAPSLEVSGRSASRTLPRRCPIPGEGVESVDVAPGEPPAQLLNGELVPHPSSGQPPQSAPRCHALLHRHSGRPEHHFHGSPALHRCEHAGAGAGRGEHRRGDEEANPQDLHDRFDGRKSAMVPSRHVSTCCSRAAYSRANGGFPERRLVLSPPAGATFMDK